MAKKEDKKEWVDWKDNPKLIKEVDNLIESFKKEADSNKRDTNQYVISFIVISFIIGLMGFFPLNNFPFISKIPSILSFIMGFLALFWHLYHPLQKYIANNNAYYQIKFLFDSYKGRIGVFYEMEERIAKKELQEKILAIRQQAHISLTQNFVDAVNKVADYTLTNKTDK